MATCRKRSSRRRRLRCWAPDRVGRGALCRGDQPHGPGIVPGPDRAWKTMRGGPRSLLQTGWRSSGDSGGEPVFGLSADDLAKINPYALLTVVGRLALAVLFAFAAAILIEFAYASAQVRLRWPPELEYLFGIPLVGLTAIWAFRGFWPRLLVGCGAASCLLYRHTLGGFSGLRRTLVMPQIQRSDRRMPHVPVRRSQYGQIRP